MTDASQTELLLTALFDGQLEGEERQRAEQLLAENDEYREMFESWRQQRQLFRDLPRHQLDEAFAFRVMRETLRDDQAITTANLRTHWQTGIAAIAALAALLFLTLFVFPRFSERNDVAEVDEVEQAEIVNNIADDIEAKPRSQRGGRPQPGSDEVATVNLGGRTDPAAASDRSEATQNRASELAENSTPRVGMPENAAQIPNPGDSPAKQELANSSAQNTSSNPDQAPPQTNRNRQKEPTPVGIGSLAGNPTTTPSPPVAQSNVDEKLAADNTNSEAEENDARVAEAKTNERLADSKRPSVDRVLLINMQHREQPLAELQRVFARNSIQILNPNNPQTQLASDDSASGAAGQPAAIRSGVTNSDQTSQFSSRSQSGMEAVFVVSTPSQMRKAIAELADQALIAGYSVPEESPATNNQGSGVQDSENGNASARQLDPWEFGKNKAGGYELKGGQELLKTEKPVNGNAANEIAELDQWFNRSAKDPDSDLIQYLLFVRTSDQESEDEHRIDGDSEAPQTDDDDK